MARTRKNTAAAGGATATRSSGKKRSFHRELVLNRWVLVFSRTARWLRSRCG